MKLVRSVIHLPESQAHCIILMESARPNYQPRTGVAKIAEEMMPKKNSHCSYRGSEFGSDEGSPRKCRACLNMTYLNPLPVAVLLLPVDGGLLTIWRAVEPHVGGLALPGGYINLGEFWQEAAARELWEETGIKILAEEIKLFDVLSATDGTVLIFGEAKGMTPANLPAFVTTDETTECVVLKSFQELAFPLHTQVAREFFRRAAPA